MKQGKTLQELAQEIERQVNAKRDFIADTQKIEMTPNRLELKLNEEYFKVNENAHDQIAGRLKIPRPYYDKMKTEAPELLAKNVNHWFQNNPEKRMIRTLDGSARAFLSERYRALDNYDLLNSALPIIAENQCQPISTEVTENRLYLKALFPKMEAEVKKGDIVQAGMVISNSEVGAGSLRVEPLIYRLVCTNGMISNTSLRKYHVGRGAGNSFEDIQEVLSDDTKFQSDKAFWMQVQDVIRSVFNRDLFLGQVEKLKEAAEIKIESNNIPEIIEKTVKTFNLTQGTGSSILRHLIEGGDLSKWGLANAVTRTANDEENYDQATNLERLGGKIIELSPKDWKIIVNA